MASRSWSVRPAVTKRASSVPVESSTPRAADRAPRRARRLQDPRQQIVQAELPAQREAGVHEARHPSPGLHGAPPGALKREARRVQPRERFHRPGPGGLGHGPGPRFPRGRPPPPRPPQPRPRRRAPGAAQIGEEAGDVGRAGGARLQPRPVSRLGPAQDRPGVVRDDEGHGVETRDLGHEAEQPGVDLPTGRGRSPCRHGSATR